jgi:hypothetical protein
MGASAKYKYKANPNESAMQNIMTMPTKIMKIS